MVLEAGASVDKTIEFDSGKRYAGIDLASTLECILIYVEFGARFVLPDGDGGLRRYGLDRYVELVNYFEVELPERAARCEEAVVAFLAAVYRQHSAWVARPVAVHIARLVWASRASKVWKNPDSLDLYPEGTSVHPTNY